MTSTTPIVLVLFQNEPGITLAHSAPFSDQPSVTPSLRLLLPLCLAVAAIFAVLLAALSRWGPGMHIRKLFLKPGAPKRTKKTKTIPTNPTKIYIYIYKIKLKYHRRFFFFFFFFYLFGAADLTSPSPAEGDFHHGQEGGATLNGEAVALPRGKMTAPPRLLICYSSRDGRAHVKAVMQLGAFIQQHMATQVGG